ncbi:putative tRNA binding protein [Hamiltosporidium tvaerminnensis]|uniref:Putative tRNA binding protein n=1 Tax=Hamiltosporidium tvaerminnensis TaxID=1176355 RepID=A0A4Q9L973_9MICR|nr:hypothetical protein LUQ84_000304 [Hamiltosporidium tvaerminnensis]TBU03795.1 putative tRNA binding protein [Hamiltosporidium tvaerminnensis]
MLVEYSPEYDDVIFAIDFMNLPIDFAFLPTEIAITIENDRYQGLKKVIDRIIDLCHCDPHDLEIINESTFGHLELIRSKNPADVIETLLENKGPDEKFIPDIPSNINIPCYFNGRSLSFCDLVLFSRLYRRVLEGKTLKPEIFNWFNCFQNEISTKKDIEIIEEKGFYLLEIHVGLIKSISDHPNADKLYVETVDMGKEITVVSGLRGRVEKEELLNKKFLFITNLKESKLRGVVSQAMIMCGIDENGTPEPLEVPSEVYTGNRATLTTDKVPVVHYFDSMIHEGKSTVFSELMGKLKIEDNFLMFKDQKVLVEGLEIKTKMKKGKVS